MKAHLCRVGKADTNVAPVLTIHPTALPIPKWKNTAL